MTAAVNRLDGFPRLSHLLRPLRSLAAVAKHGSTMRASEVLHLSQPAVARAIQDLERECGVSLFDRGARGMVPTPLGLQLAKRSDTLFHLLACGATEARAVTPPSGQHLVGPDRFASVIRPMELHALLAIADAGTEAAAAAVIGVSQPAVHAALKSLERSLGSTIGCKLSSGTRLTAAGDALLRRVKLAMAELRAMGADIACWSGLVHGPLVVGVLPLSVPIFLPKAMEALLSAHPGIEVRIVDGTYDSLLRQLMHAEVDVIAGALRDTPPSHEVRHVHLFDDELVIIARDDHPLAGRRPIRLLDLVHEKWVVPLPETPAARVMSDAFAAVGLELPPDRICVGSPALTQAFVKQTGRLALASSGHMCVQDADPCLQALCVRLPLTRRAIGVVVRSMGEPSPELRLFLEACSRAMAPAGPLDHIGVHT